MWESSSPVFLVSAGFLFRKIFAVHWPLTSAKQILFGKNTEGVLKTSIFLVCRRSVFQIFDSLGPGGRLMNLRELFWTFSQLVKVRLINLFHPPSTRENITRPERSNFNIARSGSWAFERTPRLTFSVWFSSLLVCCWASCLDCLCVWALVFSLNFCQALHARQWGTKIKWKIQDAFQKGKLSYQGG